MKQGTIKTLGAAVLGAAFAVTAAGAASAAPAVNTPDAGGLLGKLPVKVGGDAVPGGTHKVPSGPIHAPTNVNGTTLGGLPVTKLAGVAKNLSPLNKG